MKDFFANLTHYIKSGFYSHRLMWVLLFLLSCMSVWDIAFNEAVKMPDWSRLPYLIAFSGFKASIILVFLLPTYSKKWMSPIRWLIVALYLFLSVVNFVSFDFYGFGITRKLLLICGQTTKSETSQFIPSLLENILEPIKTFSFWLKLIGIFALFKITWNLKQKIWSIVWCSITLLGLISFGLYCIFIPFGKTSHSLAFRVVKNSCEIARYEAQFREMSKGKRVLEYAETIDSSHLANLIIVVLGESSSRSHYSLYGYPLETTPNLKSMQDSLIIYKDAIGSSSSTSGNMDRILTLKPDDVVEGNALEFPSVVDLFKHAGYKVFWLSNQERTGEYMNTASVLSNDADMIKYIGADNSDDLLSLRYDDALLSEIRKAIADKAENKLIFVHLMGSHMAYDLRYPKSFKFFSASDEKKAMHRPWLSESMAKTLADYDNSIRFTDHVLNEIISIAGQSPQRSVMFYFSDHGEKVYDEDATTGRGEKYVEVPFIIYANKNYRESNPDIVRLLHQSKSLPFSTANVEHQLMQVSGTNYKLYDSSRCVSSPDFKIRPRYVDERIWKYEHKD